MKHIFIFRPTERILHVTRKCQELGWRAKGLLREKFNPFGKRPLPVFFKQKMGQPGSQFVLFLSFHKDHYISIHRDSNLDCRSKRRAPLDHLPVQIPAFCLLIFESVLGRQEEKIKNFAVGEIRTLDLWSWKRPLFYKFWLDFLLAFLSLGLSRETISL